MATQLPLIHTPLTNVLVMTILGMLLGVSEDPKSAMLVCQHGLCKILIDSGICILVALSLSPLLITMDTAGHQGLTKQYLFQG